MAVSIALVQPGWVLPARLVLVVQLKINRKLFHSTHFQKKVLRGRNPKRAAEGARKFDHKSTKIIYILPMRHPTLGIPGSKPRVLPSISQMLKEAQENAPKTAGPKPRGAKAARRRGKKLATPRERRATG
jgi:hypothetical protein